MRKQTTTPPPGSFPVLFLLITFLFHSCKRDIEPVQKESTASTTAAVGTQALSMSSGCVTDQENGAAYDSLPRPTLLGARLIGTPYSVATMQQASRNLYGTTTGITENRWYVRFKPADPRQLSILDSLNLDLFDYPLDYEVTQEGDYYNDGVTPAETIPWLYTVVPVNFAFPAGIQYELLQRMHVPTLASLEREAFRITGNPVPDTTCGGTMASAGTKDGDVTINGVTCAAGYHWDPELGKCVPDNCPSGYHWDPEVMQCVSNVVTPPPPAPTRQPSGTVQVFDNNRGVNVAVRNVRVIAKNFLKVERVFTNNQGQYTLTKEFNRANIYIRTKNNQSNIRSLRRARLWQMQLAVEVHLGRFRGPLNGLQHVIGQNTNALTAGARHWAAVSAHNNVQEYYDFASQLGIGTPPGGLKMLLTNWRLQGTSGAAPMYAKRFWQELPEDFVRFYIFGAPTLPLSAYTYALKAQIDVTLGYNRGADVTATSDQMGETAFHELIHAAHYNKVGNTWWKDFVDAELNQMVFSTNPPYGTGNAGATSQIIALGESWAYHMGHFLSDRKYTGNSSFVFNQGFTYRNGDIVSNATGLIEATTNLNAHVNLLEDFDNHRTDPDGWIPEGLYYDLLDNRNDNNAVPRRVLLNDVVSGYTNQQFFNALDPDIRSLPAFRVRLLNENANNQSTGVNAIFTFYNVF